MLSQLPLTRALRVLGLIGLFVLAGGAGLRQVMADAPTPVLPYNGVITPASFDGDVRDLPYVPALSESATEPVNPQPSLFKWAAALKTGGVARQQAPAPLGPAAAMPAPALTFNAMTYTNNGAGHPPDTNGDVGPNYYVETVNTSAAVYSKATGAKLTSFTFNSLWSGAGTGTACDNANQGDPITLYDAVGQRWLIMDFAWSNIQTGPFYFCFAISKTQNPLGAYWRYAISAHSSFLPDYPKGGVWLDGFFFTANLYDCSSGSCNSNQGVRSYALNRIKMEAGQTLTANDYQAADLSTNYFSLMPSNVRFNLPAAGTPNYLVTDDSFGFHWDVFKFHADFTNFHNSTFTGPTQVSQGSYVTAAPDVAEPSPGNLIDTLTERMMFLNQYSRVGNTESLWVQHTTGTPSASTPTGIQWAQINVTGGTVNTTPLQEQIYNNGGDGLNRFMGSMAVDHAGNAALGFTAASSTLAPDIRYVGRLKGDPANTLPRTEVTMLPSVTRSVQTGYCGPDVCTRWGDYSAMTVDPVDGCTFWYANMYFPVQGGNWVTRIGSFRFPAANCVDFKHLYLPDILR